MRKIMILGAGVYQVPLIKKAKEMGIYTIVVSIPGNYPGFALADKVIYENTVDAEAILKIAQEEKIDGICTTGTDVAVATIGRVCDAMGLRGVSLDGAKIACDKALMKDAYTKAGVQTAQCLHVDLDTPLDEVESLCGKLGYPVIFKAIDSSGSRGIVKVDNAADIQKAYDAVKSVTRTDNYLIETYLVGDEFGAQAFIQDGKLEFVLPHGDYVFKGDTGVPIGHYAPYDLPQLEQEIYEQTEKAARAMGINNCAINADFMLCNGKVYVLELGARGGATCLVELVSLYYGYDYYEKMIQVALGEKADFTPVLNPGQPNASHLLMSDKTGTIQSITDDNKPNDKLIDVQFDYGVGDAVQQFRVGPHRIGHVITIGDTLEEAEAELQKAIGNIHICVQ
jgi:biotin carboxylase